MSILCIGDSLTYGRVGYSYIPYLLTEQTVINKGVNGDTTRHAYKRLEKILDSGEFGESDTCIVSIGTNDVLLPYMTTITPIWNLQMSYRCRRMHCITEDEQFGAAYEKYIINIKEHQKKIILIGLPYIQLENYPHEKLQNRIIKKLAEKYECHFVDIYTIQLQMEPEPKVFSWKYRNMRRLVDSTMMTLLYTMKDKYAMRRGLKLTVDGVHFTRKSAKALAHAVNTYLT